MYTGDAFLFRLEASEADTYLDFIADYTNNRLAYSGELDGVAVSEAQLLANVEWMLGTELAVKVEANGTGLNLSASYLGNPYNTPVTVNTANNYNWTTITQDDGTSQGEFQIAEIQVGPDGGQRARTRTRQR